MDSIKSILGQLTISPRLVKWGGVIVGVTLGITSVYKLTRRSRSHLTPNAPLNTVILHQPPRGPYAPNLVPFAIKLETFLRMAKIPYKVVSSFNKSPKGKVPWIEYNGQIVSDSAFCMQFLKKQLNIDLNKPLTQTEQAVAISLQRMVEEHLYWIYVCFPWVLEPERNIIPGLFRIPRLFVWMIQRDMRNRVLVQGIGRHSREEITLKMEEDLTALSTWLGSKKFFFGDEATEVDCSIFGQLAEFRWNMPNHTTEKILCEKFPNLREYCERMKTTFWPDWGECITHGGTREATKPCSHAKLYSCHR